MIKGDVDSIFASPKTIDLSVDEITALIVHEVARLVNDYYPINNARYLLLGYTIEEVSEYTKTSYWTVYRDLTERLPKIDPKLNEEVIELLNNRKMSNLRNGK